MRERVKKQSQRGSIIDLVDSKGSGHSPISHNLKRLHKRRLAKSMPSSGSNLESDSELCNDSEGSRPDR